MTMCWWWCQRVSFNHVLLVKIGLGQWLVYQVYQVYHHLPVGKKMGVVSTPSMNQPTNGKRTSMVLTLWKLALEQCYGKSSCSYGGFPKYGFPKKLIFPLINDFGMITWGTPISSENLHINKNHHYSPWITIINHESPLILGNRHCLVGQNEGDLFMANNGD